MLKVCNRLQTKNTFSKYIQKYLQNYSCINFSVFIPQAPHLDYCLTLPAKNSKFFVKMFDTAITAYAVTPYVLVKHDSASTYHKCRMYKRSNNTTNPLM